MVSVLSHPNSQIPLGSSITQQENTLSNPLLTLPTSVGCLANHLYPRHRNLLLVNIRRLPKERNIKSSLICQGRKVLQ